MAKKEKKSHTRRWLNEFKEFATRGNVIDLAVGVIIGGAFGKITASLVSDIFMPIIGRVIGGDSFAGWQIILVTGTDGKDDITINIGAFISTIVDFILIAFCVFLFVKLINSFRRKKDVEPEEPAAPPEPPADIALLAEIRDLLKQRTENRGQGTDL